MDRNSQNTRHSPQRTGDIHFFDSIEDRNVESKARLSFGFVLAPRFTLVAFSGFLSVLRQASDIGDRSRQVLCNWTIMGHDMSPVASSCGVQIMPWEVFRDPGEFDYVVMVGGLLREEDWCDMRLLDYLKAAAAKGVSLIGLCTGSFYLAKAGLMKGYKCCVHWYHFQDFIEEFPNLIPVTDVLFVVDRDRITCPGGSSAIDLALYLVEKRLGKDRALKCQRHLLLDWGRPDNHPQMPLTGDYSTIPDPRVRKAVFLMEQNMSGSLSVEELAQLTHSSVRQLERLFQDHTGKSPREYYRELRLKHSYWLVVNTTRSITEIAYDCGFADASHFTRWFKKTWAVSPASLRKNPC